MSLIPFAGAVQKFNRARDYRIERSLRFNSADSAYLNRTPSGAGTSATIWTFSWWQKGVALTGSTQVVFGAESGGARDMIRWDGNGSLEFVKATSTLVRVPTAKYRDPSAWYHFIINVSGATVGVYVNGVQVTAFATSNNPSGNWFINQNNLHRIGFDPTGGDALNGYLTEIHMVDGQALTPSSFGEFNSDTGVWQPKAYTGSYGTNGFYLDFSDNSGTTSTTLGKDQAGSNNWTPNNFSVTAGAGNDSLVDSPTRYGTDTGLGGQVRGNYATLNPLGNTNANQTIANGNLDHASTTSWLMAYSTLDMTSGKWYAEFLVTDVSNFQIGIIPTSGLAISTASTANSGYPGKYGYAFLYQPPNASKQSFDVTSAYGTAPSNNDIMMIAFDADSGALYTGRNGTWFNSSDPATSTSPMYSSIPMTTGYFFASGLENASGSWNFGQRPFSYTAPSGFKALVTTNLL